MSLSVSQDEGTMVITISANPKSKWPILCQFLGTSCYSSVSSAVKNMKTNMMYNYTTFGIVQIIVGLLSLVTRIEVLRFWLGSVFLMVGIVTFVAVRFPSDYLLLIAVVLNKFSAALAMTGLAFYAWDVTYNHNNEMMAITMIIFLVLQFCVTLSFSVLTLKEMCGMNTVKHREFYKPLKEELTVSHLC